MQSCLVCPTPGFNVPAEEWDPNREDWDHDFEYVDATDHFSVVRLIFF